MINTIFCYTRRKRYKSIRNMQGLFGAFKPKTHKQLHIAASRQPYRWQLVQRVYIFPPYIDMRFIATKRIVLANQ